MKRKLDTVRIISVESALTSGLIPFLAAEYIYIDRLDTPDPVLKKLMTKSSIDSVNANIAPVVIPGIISGMITFLIAFIGVAPKSIAASIRLLSICLSFGSTDNITYGMQNVMCEIIIVISPNFAENDEKTSINDIPVTISGLITGR